MGSRTIPLPRFAASANVVHAKIDRVSHPGIGKAHGVRIFATARNRKTGINHMSLRSHRVSRSLSFISTLLLTTALAAPAFAQIEEVVVTAQKKSEDIQTVPIAVTAYTSQDLKDRQIQKFDDLQFATPNVTYS